MVILLLIAVLLLATTACSITDIGGVVGNLGDALDNLFRNIGDSFHFGF